VVADHQEEGVITGELSRAMDGMGVAKWGGLLDEAHPPGMRAGGFRERGLVAGTNDDRDLLNAGGGDFPGENGEGGLGLAVAINERLEGERALGFSGGGDDGSSDFHVADSGDTAPVGNL